MPSFALPRNHTGSWLLVRFWRWWIGELAALVPPVLMPIRRPPRRVAWLSLEGRDAVLWRARGRRREEIGRIALTEDNPSADRIAFDALRKRVPGKSIGIGLRPAQVLRKAVELPLAAQGNLAQVLGFELGRHTPFTTAQAYYDFRVLHRDPSKGQIRVALTVAPRTSIDPGLALLHSWERNPEAVMIEDEILGSGHCADLLPQAMRPRRLWQRYGLPLLMLGISLVLLAAAVGIPIWQKRAQAIALLPVAHEARVRAEAVESLRQERDELLALHDFPLERKHLTPNAVVLLNELTRTLPDDTWLQQLELREGELTLHGITQRASRLVQLFEGHPLFESADFKSPLVKLQGNEERFQLTLKLRPPSLDALRRPPAASQPAQQARSGQP